MNLQLPSSWNKIMQEELTKKYFKDLMLFLESEYQEQAIYPPKEQIFNAFQLTPYDDVNVVILGQDPYHGPHQAHGLSFSVLPGNKIPPSLRNIYKELDNDIGITPPSHGCLTSWATQGVLLLNTVLTVRKGQAHSHQKKGWEIFTNTVIEKLNEREEPIIFVLWGKPAQSKLDKINQNKHVVLCAPHPSPLSAHRGFFETRPFSTINHYLEQQGKNTIDWNIPENCSITNENL